MSTHLPETLIAKYAEGGVLINTERLIRQSVNALVGPLLGEGAYRRTYALRHSPDLVLKIEYDLEFQNVREWTAWEELKGTKWDKWLAPCVGIEEDGAVLIQRRADDLTDGQWADLRRDRVPNFLGDTGRRNWGWYEGHPVMRDYGINHLMSRGLNGVRMIQPAGEDE